jgi:hypothetical protein
MEIFAEEQSIKAEEKQPPQFTNLEILLECVNFCQYKTTHHKGILKNKIQAIERNLEILIEREKAQRGINEN